MKKRLVLAVCSLLSVAGLMLAVNPAAVSAQDAKGNVCSGAAFKLSGTSDCGETDNQGRINTVIRQIINVFSIIIGIVAVVMIIYGGFRFITSGGDANAVSSSRRVIIFALIGLVIAALAQFIVKFVLARATTDIR